MAHSAEASRILFSGQAALPVTVDFWTSLAIGHRTNHDALHATVVELQQSGILAGFGGEINPAHEDIRESIVSETPASVAVRWSGGGMASVCGAGAGAQAAAWHSARWLKAGAAFGRAEELRRGDVFVPETDRTLLVRDDEWRSTAARTPEHDRVFAVAGTPIPFDPPRTPWEQIAERADTTPEAAREAVVQLVLQRRWRRFALRANAGAAGWRGCGLACWSIDPANVQRAAGALASIAATGDVCMRSPAASWPFNLTALIVAAKEDAGEEVARGISGKWGIVLGRWIPMPDFSCAPVQRG